MPINDVPVKKGLVDAANLFATKARAKAGSLPIPKNIAGAIEVGSVSMSGGEYKITVSVNVKKAPAAGAYEFGSGLRGREKKKYEIHPKEKKSLAFEWNPEFVPYGSKKFIALTKEGKYLFRYVEHPGVEARPYMKPALTESKDNMLRMIGQPFMVDVIHKSILEIWNIQ